MEYKKVQINRMRNNRTPSILADEWGLLHFYPHITLLVTALYAVIFFTSLLAALPNDTSTLKNVAKVGHTFII